MNIIERKQVTETKEVVTGFKCDNCGKIINERPLPDEWHSFTSKHNEWGNDSVESVEWHQVCSPRMLH